jgi:hypothetical protein
MLLHVRFAWDRDPEFSSRAARTLCVCERRLRPESGPLPVAVHDWFAAIATIQHSGDDQTGIKDLVHGPADDAPGMDIEDGNQLRHSRRSPNRNL